MQFLSVFHQTNDQADLSDWISALHVACSASFFRQHGKETILKLLQNEIHRMESSIDLVSVASITSGVIPRQFQFNIVFLI